MKTSDEKTIPMEEFRSELQTILQKSTGSDYASYLSHDDEFCRDVKQNVEETSAWRDEGYYNDDDIRLAIGRTILDFVGIGY